MVLYNHAVTEVLCVLFLGVEIDFDHSYEVTESDGAMVYVCAVLVSPVISCAILTPIAVNFSTYDNIAGTLLIHITPTTVTCVLCVCVHMCLCVVAVINTYLSSTQATLLYYCSYISLQTLPLTMCLYL